MKILYAEDQEVIRESMLPILDKFAEVTSCENGEVALAKFKEGQFDLVITDIEMPKMSGIALLKNIRSVNTSVPVIITTGHPKEDYVKKVAVMGACMMVKPIDVPALREAVSNYTSCRLPSGK